MLLRKLALLSEFCQQSVQQCFQFLQQDPIEQSGQISQYQAANRDEQIKKEKLNANYHDLEEPDNDHQLIENENPFEKLKPTINFQNSIPQVSLKNEKQKLKYEEEMIDVNSDANGWNNHVNEQESEHIEL